MLEDLNEYLGKEKFKFKVLKKEYLSLKDSYQELKEDHETLLLKDLTKPKVDVCITFDIIDDMPSRDVAPSIPSKASVDVAPSHVL